MKDSLLFAVCLILIGIYIVCTQIQTNTKATACYLLNQQVTPQNFPTTSQKNLDGEIINPTPDDIRIYNAVRDCIADA